MIFIRIIRLILRWLPWVLAIVAIYFLYRWAGSWFTQEDPAPVETISHHTIIEEIENIGKLELLRYNFKEITELNEKNKRYLGLFDVPDSRVVVISHGEAVGCIDLQKIRQQDVRITGDTVLVRLPEPELCYYKLDMENTSVYSVEKQVYYKKESDLVQRALRLAEREMRDAALRSGILEQTRENAESILRPLLENVSDKKVLFMQQLPEEVPLDQG